MRLNRTTLAAGVVFVLLAAGFISPATLTRQDGLGLGPVCADAQNLGQRVVSGAVVDAASSPVAGATVFLKDLKTKSIRSFTTTDRGRFRFAQVSRSQDYDLWAEKNGRKTAVKTVSSWDARKEFETELKLK